MTATTPRPLTDRQRQIYDFIVAFTKANGYAPTVREIGVEMGIKSPNGVMAHLNFLEKKGAIRRDAAKARTIMAVTSLPPNLALLALQGLVNRIVAENLIPETAPEMIQARMAIGNEGGQ